METLHNLHYVINAAPELSVCLKISWLLLLCLTAVTEKTFTYCNFNFKSVLWESDTSVFRFIVSSDQAVTLVDRVKLYMYIDYINSTWLTPLTSIHKH